MSKGIFQAHIITFEQMHRSMKNQLSFVLIAMAIFFMNMDFASNIYLTKSGHVSFLSEAPLEEIEAANDKVGSVLDVSKRSLAFQVPILAFEGFNSALQHEHFNENYMEVESYPKATFNGKIIEDIDFSTPGSHRVRAKGMLDVHGVSKERIIPGTLKITSSGISIRANFDVTLADHDIEIPSIVTQKIAEVVQVELDVTLKPQS